MPDKIANRYVLGERIGQGGMADVYLAWDEVLGRQVAIKILREKLASDPQTLVRFLREASAARRLAHPNVVEIYDVGEVDHLHYLVMEYVPGQTLKDLIAASGPMPARRAIGIMKRLTSAIVQAHANQIVHRDIKPQNVLVRKDGVLKITDFGIALSMDNASMTHLEGVMGSAHYLAPESAAGLAPDYRVDIYSLGIVFFELLCGSVPFTGTSPAAIAIKHMQDPLPRIAPYNETVTRAIENVVIKAAAKNPDERYQSAQELLEALRSCTDPARKDEPLLQLKTQALELPSRNTDTTTSPDQTPSSLRPLSHISSPKHFSWRIALLASVIGVLTLALIGFALVSSGVVPVDGVFGWHQMPSVRGMSVESALSTLEAAGIDPARIRIEKVATDQVDTGLAQSTNVPAGQFVREADEVVLKVSKGPTFLVGDYSGYYLDDVKALFAQNGVTVPIEVEEKETSNTNPGIILEQSGHFEGERIDPSGKDPFHFVIAASPSILLDPTYIGMNVYEVKEILNEKGIAVSMKNVYGSDKVVSIDPPVGSVYTQEGSDSVVTLYY